MKISKYTFLALTLLSPFAFINASEPNENQQNPENTTLPSPLEQIEGYCKEHSEDYQCEKLNKLYYCIEHQAKKYQDKLKEETINYYCSDIDKVNNNVLYHGTNIAQYLHLSLSKTTEGVEALLKKIINFKEEKIAEFNQDKANKENKETTANTPS